MSENPRNSNNDKKTTSTKMENPYKESRLTTISSGKKNAVPGRKVVWASEVETSTKTKNKVSITPTKNGKVCLSANEIYNVAKPLTLEEKTRLRNLEANNVVLPIFNKRKVAATLCNNIGLSFTMSVMDEHEWGRITKIMTSFREVIQKNPNYFLAMSIVIGVCREIDPNCRLVLVEEGKYRPETKFLPEKFDENAYSKYVFDEFHKEDTNKVIFMRTSVPNLGHLLGIWIKQGTTHCIKSSTFLYLDVADVVYFMYTDAKSINIETFTKYIRENIMFDIPFGLYQRPVWMNESKYPGSVSTIVMQSQKIHLNIARQHMLSENPYLGNNYKNIRTAPMQRTRKNQ